MAKRVPSAWTCRSRPCEALAGDESRQGSRRSPPHRLDAEAAEELSPHPPAHGLARLRFRLSRPRRDRAQDAGPNKPPGRAHSRRSAVAADEAGEPSTRQNAKSEASRSARSTPASRIVPPPWLSRSIIVPPEAVQIFRLENPERPNAVRSMTSSPWPKRVTVSLPCPLRKTKVSSPAPPSRRSSPASPDIVLSPQSAVIRSFPSPPDIVSSPLP